LTRVHIEDDGTLRADGKLTQHTYKRARGAHVQEVARCGVHTGANPGYRYPDRSNESR